MIRTPGWLFARPDHAYGVTVRGRLDSIDWAILKELQADGSITNVELARRVG
ncbi:MAG: ArsR family transcriptional regulator, partial [Microvirga sp.]|nr:ArsR family transcriptional regulator [Microvirga sp.]